jgi:hypothetical protein
MPVFRAADFVQKETQIFALRKSSQLRHIIEPHVEQPADTGAL